jgi:hypothetical protein
VLLAGIAYLSRVYHIGATEPGRSGYQSVLSQLIAAVAGKGVFYYVAMGSILVALSLSANTSFADFPRLCRAMAQHGFLPYEFATRGRRLVYSYGVYVLAFLSAILLVMFGGITDRLIPLFAIGAFLSFTMSQAGMVVHWMRKKDIPGRTRMMLLNVVGAAATGATLFIIAAAKFLEGAWMVLVVIPLLISLMVAIRHHYHRVALEISSPAPIDASDLRTPIVIVPIDEWNNVTKKALRFALTLSNDVRALHVSSDEESAMLETQWGEWAAEPAEHVGKRAPRLIVMRSPYRLVVGPIVNYVGETANGNPGSPIVVVISELVERRWYQYLLHNQRAHVLTALLLLAGHRQTAVVNVPWYLDAKP